MHTSRHVVRIGWKFMAMKFSALNREASNSSALSTPSSKKGRPTQEAQESACLKLYHNAMKLQQEGKWEEAKALYCEILESEVMENDITLSGTILRLKFLIYKNIASIAREQGDLSAAADAYIEATSVDRSDVTVWYQLSSMGSLLGNLLLARKALEQAVLCQPTYWPALESLCTILYALGDFTACLQVIGRGLEMDAQFPRGLAYLQQIVLEYPELVDLQCPQLRMHLLTSQPEGTGRFLEDAIVLWRRREALNGVIALRDPIVPPKKLALLTFSCLASCLLSLYKHCKELSQRSASFTIPVDLSQLLDTPPTALPHPSSSPAGRVCGEGGEMQGAVEGGKGRGSGEEGKAVTTRRETKRKLWEDLEAFAPKRRSSRVLTRQRDKDHTNYFDMLLKYLPPWLMMKQLPEIAQFSPLKKPKPDHEDERAMSERKQQVSALIDSTPHLLEVAMVRRYVNQFQSNVGALQLMHQFLQLLALHYDQKWCRGDGVLLSRLFVELYDCLHGHLCYPSPLCSPMEAQKEGFKRVAMLALCHVEMYIDTLKSKKRSPFADSAATSSLPKPCRSFLQCLSFVRHCDGMVGSSALETVTFTLRVQWGVAKWELYSGNHDSAIQSLTLCRDLLQVFVPEEAEEKMVDSWNLMVHLPNCSNGGVISLDHVVEKLRELEQSVSLKQIRQMFDRKEYSMVVQKLEPFLEYNTTIPTDFLMGSRGMASDVTNLSLLLDSFLHLKCYYSCLQTAVQAALQLLQNYHLGNDLWTSSMRHVFRVLNECLSSSEGREQLREKIDERLLKRLVVCLLKTMDVVYDMADTDFFFSMPVALPWKMLYIIISNDWKLAEEEDAIELVRGPTDAEVKIPGLGMSIEEKCGDGRSPDVAMETRGDQMDTSASGDLEDNHPCTKEDKMDTSPSRIECESRPGAEMGGGALHGDKVGDFALSLESGRDPKVGADIIQEGGKMGVSAPASGGGSGRDPKVGADIIQEGGKMGVSVPASGSGSGHVPGNMSVPLPPSPSELSQLMLAIDAETGTVSPSERGSEDSNRSSSEGLGGRGSEVPTDPCGQGLEDRDSAVPSGRSSVVPSGRSSVVPSGCEAPMEELSVPLQFLCEAHTHLGKMGWCCRDSAAFLLESVQALRQELRILTAWPVKQREVLLQELEQCYYCLHGHPHRRARARGLVDHNSEQIPLKWESALMLIQHYHPVPLPSIDDAKSPQVTPEVIHLYKRIVEVFPEHGKVLSKEALESFIEGQSSELTDLRPSHEHSSIMSDVCYILADDALKGMDNHKAIRYYQNNLCYSPDQFDSWAGLALGRSRIILDRLKQRNFKSGMEKYIRKHTSSTLICFRKAISLNNKHCYIIEKFGFFCYAIQSFASQIVRQPRLFILSGIHPWAATTHKEMLQLASKCFTDALSLEATKHAEPWIYHWMLGKIGCKLEDRIKTIMTHLVKSAQILYKDEAAYPEVVEISSKLHAVEAVEVHYQLHSIALKHLLRFQALSSGQDSNSGQGTSSPDGYDKGKRVEVESSIAEALMQLKRLPLCQRSYPTLWVWTKDLCREAFEVGHSRKGAGQPRKEAVAPDLLSLGPSVEAIAEDEEMDVDVVGHTSTSATPPPIVSSQACTSLLQLPSTSATPTPTVYSQACTSLLQLPSTSATPPPTVSSQAHTSLVQLPSTSATPTHTVSSQAYTSLLQLCLYGVAVCAVRYPAFFKPLYRMAATLQSIGLTKHARKLLLGPLPSALTKCQEKLQPLLVLRTNIFTNMWQVPSEEINRPGSFSSHARRNLELLVCVLCDLGDTQTLLMLAQHLRTKPDVTKQYLRDNERVAMHTKVVKLCVQILVRASEGEFTAEEAVQYKATSTAVRSMASKLDTDLIKGLDRAIGCFQTAVHVASAPAMPPESADDTSCPHAESGGSHDLPAVPHVAAKPSLDLVAKDTSHSRSHDLPAVPHATKPPASSLVAKDTLHLPAVPNATKPPASSLVAKDTSHSRSHDLPAVPGVAVKPPSSLVAKDTSHPCAESSKLPAVFHAAESAKDTTTHLSGESIKSHNPATVPSQWHSTSGAKDLSKSHDTTANIPSRSSEVQSMELTPPMSRPLGTSHDLKPIPHLVRVPQDLDHTPPTLVSSLHHTSPISHTSGASPDLSPITHIPSGSQDNPTPPLKVSHDTDPTPPLSMHPRGN